jgi:putative sterol carrier protein
MLKNALILICLTSFFYSNPVLADELSQLEKSVTVLDEKLVNSPEWIAEGYEIYFEITDQNGGIKISNQIEVLEKSFFKSNSESKNPSLVFQLKLTDFKKLLNSEATFTQLFMTGLLVVDGDMQEAIDIVGIFTKLYIKPPEGRDTSDDWCC